MVPGRIHKAKGRFGFFKLGVIAASSCADRNDPVESEINDPGKRGAKSLKLGGIGSNIKVERMASGKNKDSLSIINKRKARVYVYRTW